MTLSRLQAEQSRITQEISNLAQTLSAYWLSMEEGGSYAHDHYTYQLERLALQRTHLYVIEQAIKHHNEQN